MIVTAPEATTPASTQIPALDMHQVCQRGRSAHLAAANSGTLRCVLPAPVRDAVDVLLERVDRALPGRVDGFYVVGSVSLGGFRIQRSDVDFVAIVSGALGDHDVRRLRRAHLACCASAVCQTVPRRRWPLLCNGVYVTAADLARSPLGVAPLAPHVAGRFLVGRASMSTP